MVAQFLRLRLAAASNAHRRRPTQLLGLALSALAIGALTVAAVWLLSTIAATGATADALTEPRTHATTAVLLGAAVTVLCFVVPLVLGADDRFDPRQFAPFGLGAGRLAWGLLAASVVSVPAVALTVLAVAQAIVWGAHPAALGFAIVSVPLIVATGLLMIRVATSLSAILLSGRQVRDVVGLVAFASLTLLAPVAVLLAFSDWSTTLKAPDQFADVLARTPLAAAWAAPADAALGNTGAAFGSLALAAAYLVVLAVAWRALVGVLLLTPVRERTERHRVHLGWFEVTPKTAGGVIAARSISYWGRDPRYRTSIVVVPVIPLLVVGALLLAGAPFNYLMLLVVPVMCLFLGWGTLHNDLAYDHSALWLHVAAHTRGINDRLGRILPPFLIGIPLIAIGAPITAWLFGDLDAVWTIVGVGTAALLAALGVSSVFSVLAPYPAAHPGNSAFEQPQTADTGAFGAQAGSFLLTLIVCIPTLLMGWDAIFDGGVSHALTAVVGGATGVVVLALGLWLGGVVFDRRRPELLAFTMRY
ncbi:MAG: ABC transporter permease [Cryobacterium sp.]|nr:ABC transporter permease [Cryobacterium sp.]